MFKESEHPRDELGRFTDGEEETKEVIDNYVSTPQEFREKFKGKTLNTNKIDKNNIKLLLDIYDNNPPKNLSLLQNYELSQAMGYGNYSKDEILERVEKAIEQAEKKQKEKEEKEKKALQMQEEDKQFELNAFQKDGFSPSQAEKLRQANKEIEKYLDHVAIQKYNVKDGYSGMSKSKRALEDESKGNFNLSTASKLLGVSQDKIKKYFKPISWHHTGAMYNETTYYDLSDVVDYFSGFVGENSQETKKVRDILKEMY